MSISQLQKMIDQSEKIVFFGGAGVSTASGIPDFRSADGLYSQQFSYPPETMLSHSFYKSHTLEFFQFYRSQMLFLDAKPNEAHLALTALEQAGKLLAVITQNIDGLHQKAGTEQVLELHGSVLRNDCELCHRFYSVDFIVDSSGIPTCSCGGTIKPDVVLYEESLDADVLQKTTDVLSEADLLIIGGTSLTVYPAAGLVDLFQGKNLVIINRSVTSKDQKTDLLLTGDIAQIFSQLTL